MTFTAVVPRHLFAGVCLVGCPSGFFLDLPPSAMLASLSLLRRAAPSLRRAASSSPTAYTYTRHGHPSAVITPSTAPAAAAPSGDQVAVSFLVAGVDAGDVAAVMGVDGGVGKAPFPRVAGHGGVALVTKVGSSVKGLKEGDYVVPAKVRACNSGGVGDRPPGPSFCGSCSRWGWRSVSLLRFGSHKTPLCGRCLCLRRAGLFWWSGSLSGHRTLSSLLTCWIYVMSHLASHCVPFLLSLSTGWSGHVASRGGAVLLGRAGRAQVGAAGGGGDAHLWCLDCSPAA